MHALLVTFRRPWVKIISDFVEILVRKSCIFTQPLTGLKKRADSFALLRDYASLWTFAEHFYQTVEPRSLFGELFPF